jgi:uncharacterized protein YndB with AHSA1/START domain
MSDALTATASITIDASPDEVWHALTDPGTIERYYFGTTAATTLTLTQDNNADTAAVEHSQANWTTVLEGLRTVVEG